MQKRLHLSWLGVACLPMLGCTLVPGLQTASGAAKLQVTPLVLTGGYHTQAVVSPWTASQVARVEIAVLTLSSDRAVETPTLLEGKAIVLNLSKESLGTPFTVTGLAPNTTYRLRARAFKSVEALAGDVISEEARSFLDVAVGSDDRPVVATMSIKLKDVAFDGWANAPALEFLPGELAPVGSGSLGLGAAPTAKEE